MKKQTFYIKGTKAAQITFDPKTNLADWIFFEPWDLLLAVVGNEVPVEVESGDNFGIFTTSDLKIKAFGTDTFKRP